MKTKILLPENVAKLLSSSNIEAGFFSKKPLTNKEALKLLDKYSNEFKKLFSKLANKIDDPKLLLDYTIKSMEEVKKEKKSGFFKDWNKETEIDFVRKEGKKLFEKYKDKIHGQIMCQISSEVFDDISEYFKRTKYEKNSNTEALRKDLIKIRKEYEPSCDLHVMNEEICEMLWDGEDELGYEN